MRILVLLKYGKHYVADEALEQGEWGNFVSFELATGGVVRIPIDNLAAVEEYQDSEIEAFRTRLHQVEADRG